MLNRALRFLMIFFTTSSIRLGSILSPNLHNIYVDERNLLLSNSKIGCHIREKPLNYLSYADDLAVLASSSRTLNKLLATCDALTKKKFSSSLAQLDQL